MDYLIAAILGYGVVAGILAYLSIKSENRLFQDYFFILTMLVLMGGLVLLQTASGIEVHEDWDQWTNLTSNITSYNKTISYNITAGTTGLSEGIFIVLLGSFLFIAVLLVFRNILEVFAKFSEITDKKKSLQKLLKRRDMER